MIKARVKPRIITKNKKSNVVRIYAKQLATDFMELKGRIVSNGKGRDRQRIWFEGPFYRLYRTHKLTGFGSIKNTGPVRKCKLNKNMKDIAVYRINATEEVIEACKAMLPYLDKKYPHYEGARLIAIHGEEGMGMYKKLKESNI